MTIKEINILLEIHNTDLTKVANEIGENRNFVSNVVNYQRDFKQPAVRRVALLFATRFNLAIEYVFDGVEPATKKELKETIKTLQHLDLAATV